MPVAELLSWLRTHRRPSDAGPALRAI